MPRERITRRQKNLSRLVRERKQVAGSRLKARRKVPTLLPTDTVACCFSAVGLKTTRKWPSPLHQYPRIS